MTYGETPASIEEVISLVSSGDKTGARRMVMLLLQRNPQDVIAMLWLAYTSTSIDEVEVILNRVLMLEPSNQKALEWQALIQQKHGQPKSPQGVPLPPTPPMPLQGTGYNGSYGSRPTQSLNSFSPTSSQALSPVNPTPPIKTWKPQPSQYQLTVENPSQSYPSLNYVQFTPDSKKNWWLMAGLGLVLTLLILGLVFFLLFKGKTNTGLADYRLFGSLDEMTRDGFVNEQVAIDTRFMGGYTKDSNGTYLIILKENKSTVFVQWHDSVAPVNDFRPGQFITIYGKILGVENGKATLKVDKVVPTSRE